MLAPPLTDEDRAVRGFDEDCKSDDVVAVVWHVTAPPSQSWYILQERVGHCLDVLTTTDQDQVSLSRSYATFFLSFFSFIFFFLFFPFNFSPSF